MTRPVLILGGTAQAREVAAGLMDRGDCPISSLAGRVRDPALPVGEIIIGGFGGALGLRDWLVTSNCRAVIDATQPFAQRISANAADAATTSDVPLVRLQRPAWIPDARDRWVEVEDMDRAAVEVAARGHRVFLTTGRQDVAAFADIASAWFLVRVVDPPSAALPPHHRILRSRGPYDLGEERNLLRAHRIDLLVTKNSGGERTRPKLVAAAEADIEVVMIRRPPAVGDADEVASAAAALEWLDQIDDRS